MPKFHYTAKRGPTDVVEGDIDADSRGGVLAYLSELGYVPVRVIEQTVAVAAVQARPAARPRRVPSSQLTMFTRQFASLVRSHVPLLRALRILEDQAKHPYFRQVLRDVTEEVRQGQTLSASLAKFPKVFSDLYVNLVRSGEASGALDAVLERLMEQLEQEEAMRARVRAAFTYPAFVAVVGAGTIAFLMAFVMPRLSELLLGLGERLPLATRVLLAVTGWMSTGWFWGGLLAAGAAAALAWRAAGAAGQSALDHIVLRLPLFGPLIVQIEMARFARAFGLQLTHGIPILQAIETAIPVVRHRVIHAQLARLPEGLRQGNALSTGLTGLSVSSAFLTHTVAVGEESGQVGEALVEVAKYYERDVERALQAMATLLEPMLIVGVGLIVGFIVMAVLLPIFEMGTINP